VIPSSQHPSTRAGAESIQLIYSGRALRALNDLTRQFWCHPIFWRESEIFSNYDETKLKEEKNKKNAARAKKVHVIGRVYDTGHGGSKATSKWQ